MAGRGVKVAPILYFSCRAPASICIVSASASSVPVSSGNSGASVTSTSRSVRWMALVRVSALSIESCAWLSFS